MKNNSLILGVCCLFMVLSFGKAHSEAVKLVTISAMKSSSAHHMAEGVVREAYQRIGIQVEFENVPPQRSLEIANMGQTDGEMARIAGTEKVFPNLIPIPVPVAYIQAYAFTKRIKRPVRIWADLKGLKIGIVKGVRYSELGTLGMKTYPARSYPHLFQLLESDRIDVAIALKEAGEKEILLHYKTSGMHMTGDKLYSAPLYHYIHKKNMNLVPSLEATLSHMEKQGVIKAIWKKAREEFLLKPDVTDD